MTKIDEFDPSTARIVSNNKDDEFDPSTAKLSSDTHNPNSRSWGTVASDVGNSIASGAAAAGRGILGLSDLVTGSNSIQNTKNLGLDIKSSEQAWKDNLSEKAKQEEQAWNNTQGFVDTLKYGATHPFAVVNKVAESLPAMAVSGGMGGAVAKGVVGGAIGEGMQQAGSSYADAIEKNNGNTPTDKDAGAALGSGVTTGTISALSGGLAKKLGIGDIDTAIANRVAGEAATSARPLGLGAYAKNIGKGIVTEGALEELPQSATEQTWQNYADGNPIMEGVPEAAAQGLITGGLMGGAFNATNLPTFDKPQNDQGNQDSQGQSSGPMPEVLPPDGSNGLPNNAQPNTFNGSYRDLTPSNAPQLTNEPQPEGAPSNNAPVSETLAPNGLGLNLLQLNNATSETPEVQAGNLSPSQELGIDPNQGGLSSAAAVAVDTGASPITAELQRQATQSQPNEQANWLNGIASPTAQNQNEAPQLGYSPSENTDTPPAQQAQVADLWNSQDPQQRMAILGGIYGNEDMARQNALASFDKLPKPAQQQIADIAVQNGAVSEYSNTQSSNGQTTQTAPQAPLTTLAQDIAPASQANAAPAIEPILGRDGKNKWFATQNKADEFIQKKSLGDNYTIEQTGKMRYEIVPKVQPQAEQTAQANDASSQQQNNIFESAGTPKNRESLLLDYQTHSNAIDKDIESRGLTEQLHSIAGATTERPFSEMSKEKKAKAYADLVESGAKPAHIMETSDEQAARLEQSAEMRRLQSTDTITQKNGKPFKQQQAAEKIIQENNLRFTHEVKQVDDGFILKQLSPAAQQEAKNKADGIESYTDIQSRVAKDMGIGTNEYGEYDVSDEQFAEMNKRVDAIQREQRGLKPAQEPQRTQQERRQMVIDAYNTDNNPPVDAGNYAQQKAKVTIERVKQQSPSLYEEAKQLAENAEVATNKTNGRTAHYLTFANDDAYQADPFLGKKPSKDEIMVEALMHVTRDNAPMPPTANSTETPQPKLYGKESYIQTGSERQPTRVAVVEADSLAPDDKNTDNQFRDRTRSASQMQIDSIANNLDPRQLTDSTTMATGSPTLANDGKTIIAGNGRTKAIKQAYAQGKGAEYKQSLIEQAQSLGIDPQQIAGMKNPVLVKEFANPVDVKKMAIESNATGGLAMSAKEQARADSALLPDVSMLASDDKGNINLSRNAPVFRKFISSLPVEAQASMLDKDGLLSKEGLSRLQNAVLYKAYGDSKAFDDMVENTDVDVKNAINGLTQVAPKIAQTKESINKGTSYDADISDDITAALSLLQQIRKNEMSVSDYLSQMGLFDDGLSPVAKEFIQYIDANIRSAKAIADLLSAYYDNLDKLGNPNQQDLLGGKPNTDKQSLFKQALEQVKNAKQQTKQQTDLFSQSDADTAGQPANQTDNAVEQRPNQSQGDGAGVGTNESAKPSDEQVKTALKELVSDDVWSGEKALIISPSFAQKVADQLGYQGNIQNKADGTMSDFAKQVNDVYGGMIKNQANLSNQKAKGTPQPSKTEVYADELEKWVANTKSAAEFARSVTSLRDSQLPKGVNVDFYNFIAQAIGAKSPQTIGFRIKLEEYWLAANDTKNNNAQSTNKYEKFQSPIISDDTFENTQQQTNGAKEIKFESNKNYQFEYDVNAALDADGFNQEGDFLRLDYKNKNQPLSAAKSYGARVFFSYNQTTGKVSSIISVYTDSTHKRSIEITNEPNNQYPKVKFETEFYKPLFDVVAKDGRAFQDYIDSGKWQAEKDAKREQIKQNFIDNKPAIFTDLAKKYMSASLVDLAGVETAEQFRSLSDESQAETFAKLVEQTGYVPPKKKSKPTNDKEGIAKTRAKKQTAKAKPSEPKYSQMGNGQDDKSAFDYGFTNNNADIGIKTIVQRIKSAITSQFQNGLLSKATGIRLSKELDDFQKDNVGMVKKVWEWIYSSPKLDSIISRAGFDGIKVNDGDADNYSIYPIGDNQSNLNLLAPNGKPSNLTPEQYAQVRTKEFKDWFGDWENDPDNASKIIDENGEPMVMYHTTSKEFNSFNVGWRGLLYFAKNARGAIKGSMNGSKYMMPVFLNARNTQGDKNIGIDYTVAEMPSYIDEMKNNNVDGMYVKDESGISIALFNPNQVKSAFYNTGAFDPNNNDIRYSQTGEYTPDLIVTHNLTADAIIHADKIGGLPFASIAITKQDNPLTGFGEVTLIGDKNLIDPKGANKAKVFGSDIYSPRYPRVVVKADSKKLAQFNKDLEPARQVIESSQQISEEDFAGKYNVLNDNLVKLHFLQQNGINIERKYREVEEEVSGNKDQIDSAKADVKSLEQFADAFGVNNVEQYLAQATDSEIYTKVQEIGENNPDAFDAIFKTLADAKVERSPFKTRVRMLMDNIRMSRGKTGNYLIGSLQSMAGVVSGRTQLVEDGVRKKQVFDYSDTINQIDKALADNNLEQAFNDYIDNVRSDLVIDERLDNGVTSTGAKRTVAHTIENVVKKLKKDLRGGESFNYGLPSVRAKVTPQFKTVQQIQESKDKIITSEKFDFIKKEIDDEMSDLSDKLGLESYLDIGDFLVDVIDNGADKAFDFFNVKNSVPNKKLVADFLAKLKDMPTTYFEVKAKEVTQFSDFTGAVVPNSISHKARNILEQAGLKLYTYGSNVGIERADAIKQATTELNNTNGNILFSQTNDTESKLRSELQSLMTMQKQASQGLSLTERANSKQLREIIRRIDETKSELQRVLDQKSQPMQSNSGKENLIVSEYTGSRTVYHGTKAAVADEIMQNGIKFGAQLNDGDYRGGGYGVIQNSTSASLDPNVSKNFSNDAKPNIVKIQLADDAKIITVENEMYAEDLEDYADELKGIDAVYLANNGEQEVVILNKDKVKVVESRGFSIRDAIPRFSVLNQEQGQVQSQAPSNPTNRTKSNQAAVQNITKTLSDKFGKAAIDKLIADGNLEIIDFAEAKRRNPKTPSKADGYYADGKAVLIADNLSPDMIIPTFLHELGGHGGLQTLMSDSAYQSLLKEFDRMVAEGNQLAKDAKAFADATSPNAKVAQDEYLPYLISLAAKAQGNSKVKSMLNRIVMAVKSFIRDKFGVSLKVTPADIVALAEKMVSERAMQGKSITDNIGTFNPESDDIRYSQMGGSQAQQNKLTKALTEFFKNPLSFAKTIADNKYTDNLGKALALLGRRQLVDIYKKDLPPIKEYSDIVEQMDADSNEKAYEADKLVKEWGKLKDELPLAELMHDATLKGIDPAEAYQTGDDRATYQQLRRRYDALSPDAKRIYKQARDDYKAQQRSVFEAIKGRIQRTTMSAPRQAELIRKMEQGFFFGQKVYFPLARFGNYVVAVKDAAGDIISVSRAETKGQADELRKELIAQYPNDKVGRVMLDKEFVSSRDGVTRGFMSDLFEAVDKLNISSQERAEFEDTLGQLYLNSLPDISFAKSGMHRKGTPGFSQNARRAYAQHMSRGSHYIAKMRHSDVLQAKLDEMQEYVKAQGEADPNYDQPKMQRVVDEMEKRHELLMNTAHSTLSTLATSVGFMWYMGLSPASAIVNLSQTALVAYPIMGAKWGFDKAGKELLIASGQVAKALNDIQSVLTRDEKKAVEAAISSGVIDKTQAHDLAGVARGEDDSVMWKIRKPMEWASFMFHHAEKFNRQVTFVASYRLARQAGFDTKSAILQARDMTWDTQYNYEQSNRPRIMQGNWQRVIFLFKQYGQNMTYTLLRNAYLAAKGDKQALRTLAGMLVMHGTFAGILGLPLVSTLLSAASMLGGDDDEPWDAEIALRNYLAELLGDDASEVISKGLPRALGIDLSSRVGLDSLILPRMQEGLEGQRAGENTLAAFAGPVFGIGVNAMAGISDIQNGNTLIGTEKLLPKAVRDLVKTYRYATEGIIDKTGIEIVPQENISLSDVGQQALGFRSGKIAQAQEGKSAIYKMDKEIGSKRQRLMNRYAKAYMAGDTIAADEAWQDIKRFNAGIGKDYPKLKITKPKLMQSIKQRRRRIEDAEDGIYLPSSREASRQYGSFATE